MYANLNIVRCNLSQEVQNRSGEDGVDADEEIDAHVGDESCLCTLKDPR